MQLPTKTSGYYCSRLVTRVDGVITMGQLLQLEYCHGSDILLSNVLESRPYLYKPSVHDCRKNGFLVRCFDPRPPGPIFDKGGKIGLLFPTNSPIMYELAQWRHFRNTNVVIITHRPGKQGVSQPKMTNPSTNFKCELQNSLWVALSAIIVHLMPVG